MTPADVELLYVSRSGAAGLVQAAAIADIVAVAQSRNAQLDVTGALIWTGAAFAQVLEGAPAAVDALMGSIRRDPRHSAVQVVLTAPIARRRFRPWRMAYCGTAGYVAAHVDPLFSASLQAPDPARTQKLIRLMLAFSRDLDARP